MKKIVDWIFSIITDEPIVIKGDGYKLTYPNDEAYAVSASLKRTVKRLYRGRASKTKSLVSISTPRTFKL